MVCSTWGPVGSTVSGTGLQPHVSGSNLSLELLSDGEILANVMVQADHVVLQHESALLGAISLFEGVVSIFISQAGRADGSSRHSAAFAPNGDLEEMGQFTVSVGDMILVGPLHWPH